MQARVIGDSQSLVGIMARKKKPIDIGFRQTILIIKETASKFQNLNYYHVLQTNNSKADQAANKAVGLEPNVLLLNEDETRWDPRP